MLTERDKERLQGVDSRLVKVVSRAALDNPGLFFVDAHACRTVGQEEQLMEAGVSRVHDPYSSKHVTGPRRPLSHAVDLYPCGYKTVAEMPPEGYARVAAAVLKAASDEGVRVAWGWALWHWDQPHFQLVDP